MADRRMISAKVVCSDAFLSLPYSAQALYYQLLTQADDDGFLNNANQVRTAMGAKKKDLDILTEKRFILSFPEGVVVIKHWRMANSLRKDRTRPLRYPSVAAKVYIKQNDAYTDHPEPGAVSVQEWKQAALADQKTTKNPPNRTEENRTEENRTEENRTEENPTEPNPTEAAGWETVRDRYPAEHRGGEEGAKAAYIALALDGEAVEDLLKNLENWKKSRQWKKNGGRYIPNLESFLRKGLWRAAPPREPSLYGCSGLGEAELEAIQRVLREEV